LLKKAGYCVDSAFDGQAGLEKVQKQYYEFILCDLKMPVMDGMTFLKTAEKYLEKTTVIMMSAYGTIDTAVDAMKHGAYDYISKPFKTDEVLLSLKKAEEREHLKKENLQLKKRIREIEENYAFGKMIAKSKMMKQIFDLTRKVANYDTTVLIMGESGTGKELIARGIHQEGNRAGSPWIPVNCGGIPENLLESEFFGYKKGAFTGADVNKKGLFEAANKGTLFLDEIGELPLSLQVKLLRVLQEQEVRPIGDSGSKKIDVRVIAATVKDLEKEIKAGRFRQDLFYRLNVVKILIPPLKARIEDIPLLTVHFVDQFKKRFNKKISRISPSLIKLLLQYSWPGNVRELKNLIERAIILSETDELTPEDFPPELNKHQETRIHDNIFDGFSLKEARKITEKLLITKALEATGGNRTRASQLLEISHPSLLSKIKAYNISI
jgi:two-component system response regulator AtoC